ncbi:zinc-dependent alcohol dehydrogenase family protein [Nocardiopsis dassonvillei]|uniref:Alcohol dehydrogenase zinc-binding domain protein n=1 Tax=Nocardiopsis dassonvillei (strain ATCC 23218 / DSM 43111 / CIP 107115 / JCM 7437 / KCTC 9190 / NBRC 14626 / NCTC 10488 / NRRL B-5397 / IMRU 509) TaxID=446468 RepID=D7B2G8_NOCDD|nr:zinc-dependent alcohol dehydrogenase family protein [Nocardiopsis dassonvillei]ADH68625.1 Alcohol dehydrogenase zinc-binding domain protein [Nocardiopsis dassonvillei subsp. dassonvillei DSM 43111]NKY78526.1 zinc-dependent alcohol dehydrogenase family protein [Nocardiopsis dassonvillei]VEI89134.1 Quinone oxidoreductase 1 [Nocardiopsis dassonvillei]
MPRVVVFDEFGGPETMHIVEEPVSEPGSGEVRVRIEAFAVNPLDQMMRSGTSPAPVPLPHARLGIEGTGVVDALGPRVPGLKIGDPVILTAIPDAGVRGSYAEYTTVPADRVIVRPASLGVAEAAAIWVAFSTAFGALVEKARMLPGDHVLITAASGSVGRAAVQIANQIGAVPIAVTRSAAKKDVLLAAGAAAAIATDEADIAEAVHHHTGGTGADIILDLVMGPGQQDLLAAARPGGTLVAAGFLDPQPAPFPTGAPLTVFSYQSFEHTLDDVVVKRMSAFLNAGVRLGALQPAIDRVFTLDDIVEAHRHLEKGIHTGKIVVTT